MIPLLLKLLSHLKLGLLALFFKPMPKNFVEFWYCLILIRDLVFNSCTVYDVVCFDAEFFDWFVPHMELFVKYSAGRPANTSEYKWRKTLNNMLLYAKKLQQLSKKKADYDETPEYKKFMYLFSKNLPNLRF